jgi:hypothetical protein
LSQHNVVLVMGYITLSHQRAGKVIGGFVQNVGRMHNELISYEDAPCSWKVYKCTTMSKNEGHVCSQFPTCAVTASSHVLHSLHCCHTAGINDLPTDIIFQQRTAYPPLRDILSALSICTCLALSLSLAAMTTVQPSKACHA